MLAHHRRQKRQQHMHLMLSCPWMRGQIWEACGANLDDVDLESNVARLMGKGSKQRLVPVGSYACEAIARYLKNGRPQP